MEKDSKIYIAGGTGMVGSSIIKRLLSSGYTNIVSNYYKRKPDLNLNLNLNLSSVQFIELDLRRQEDTERFFEKERPEYVFLAAAKVGGILANSTYKADFIYDNIMIASNVIHSAYKYEVKKLLNLGSSCIYPKYASQPMKEEYLLTGLLEPTNEPYAIAKISAIKLCKYYNEQYGTNFISVMPTNLYGPNDNFDLETSHVLPALIRKMHLGKCLQNSDFESIRKDLKKYPIGNCDVTKLKDEEIINLLSQYGIKVNFSDN
jgi:GDP-L-fucose synthase